MAITRSDVLIFSAGIAVGAVACATYPLWKEKLAPLLSGLMAGAGAACSDAKAEASQTETQTSGSRFDTSHDPISEIWQRLKTNGAPQTAAS